MIAPIVQTRLLTGYLLCKTGSLTKSMNLYFHSFEIRFWANRMGYWTTFVQNGLLMGYLLCKTGYPRATSQNQWICTFMHLKFISEQVRRPTGLPLCTIVQNGLLMGYLLCKTATHGLPHKINEFVFSFIWNLFLSKYDGLPGYHCAPLFKMGYWRAAYCVRRATRGLPF